MQGLIEHRDIFLDYPFGMVMPGRSWTAASADGYRFGFNGKERDDDVKGNNNSLDYGARIYDSRVGRWLSLDPLYNQYPWNSPYISFSNNPISRIDPTGLGDYYAKDGSHLGSDNKKVKSGDGKDNKLIPDDKAYVTSQSVIDKNTVDGVTDWDKVLASSTTKELGVTNSSLNKFANTVRIESGYEYSSDQAESYGIASAIVNLAKIKYGGDISKTLKSEGIYGYNNGGNSTAYNNNAEQSMGAAINALTGGTDYSNGAIRWDGKDLANKGFDQYRPRTAGIFISPSLYVTYTTNIINMTGTSVSSNFSSGVHLATQGTNVGRCLYIATAAHGATIFFGKNGTDFTYSLSLKIPGCTVSGDYFTNGGSDPNGGCVNYSTQQPNKGFNGSW